MILPVEPPVTPDGDTAQSWAESELSRAEYGTELSPLTRFFRTIIQALMDALSGSGAPKIPLALVLLIVFAVGLVVLLTIVVTTAVRRSTMSESSAVFDGSEHSLEDSRRKFDEACGNGQWDDAYVWAFRVLVLTLAQRHVVTEGPGLTAREAVTEALPFYGILREELLGSAELFDAVRYGTNHATTEDVQRIARLLERIESAPPTERRPRESEDMTPGVPAPIGSRADQ